MPASPPLLIDTTSLLLASLDRFGPPAFPDNHSLTVIESLILFEKILLDGPSIERNADHLHWLADVEEGIEILDMTADDQSALYKSTAILAHQIRPTSNIGHFMDIQMPPVLGNEIQGSGRERLAAFGPSTYWRHLEGVMESDDLKKLKEVLDTVLGSNVPYSGAAFVAIARSLYYLCLQGTVGSSLLLDPLKGLETYAPGNSQAQTRRILDLFDNEVRAAFEERKRRWLGQMPRSLHLPLMANYINSEASRRGWSMGRVILSMRQSREVELFRQGQNELQEAVDSNDAEELDAIFADLNDAAAKWSKQLGVSRKSGSEVSVSVSLPFVGVAKSLPLPHLRRRSASDKLLVFVRQMLSAT